MSETSEEFARRIGQALVTVNALPKAAEPMRVGSCEVGEACWCRLVIAGDGSVIVSMPKDDAESFVALANATPSIAALAELLDQPTWCGRCGRNDLRLWGYHEHVRHCMSTTDEEHEIATLKADLEDAKREIAELRQKIPAKKRTWGYDG